MVAESSPWLPASPEAEVTRGPLFSPALCPCMRVQSLITNATHFLPQRALVFAGEWCSGCAPNEALVRCYSQLKRAPELPASRVTGLLARSPFHLTTLLLNIVIFGFKKVWGGWGAMARGGHGATSHRHLRLSHSSLRFCGTETQ